MISLVNTKYMRDFEVFMVIKIQVVVFWVLTPCSVVVGYQHSRGPCCLHLQGEAGGIIILKTMT
jgi:hypothetical protein